MNLSIPQDITFTASAEPELDPDGTRWLTVDEMVDTGVQYLALLGWRKTVNGRSPSAYYLKHPAASWGARYGLAHYLTEAAMITAAERLGVPMIKYQGRGCDGEVLQHALLGVRQGERDIWMEERTLALAASRADRSQVETAVEYLRALVPLTAVSQHCPGVELLRKQAAALGRLRGVETVVSRAAMVQAVAELGLPMERIDGEPRNPRIGVSMRSVQALVRQMGLGLMAAA